MKIILKVWDFNCKSVIIVNDEIDCIKMVFYVGEINGMEFAY